MTLFDQCEFSRNVAAGGGGAFYHTGEEGNFQACTFTENSAVDGGALYLHTTVVTVNDCRFSYNLASDRGGAVRVQWEPPSPTFARCIFEWNGAAYGGAVALWDSRPIFTSCTFYSNSATAAGACIRNRAGTVQMNNTILSFSRSGGAVDHFGTDAVTLLECCDVFGNVAGPDDVEDQIGVNGNFAADPLFCDPWQGDLTLQSDSPCSAEHNPDCDLVGALPVGCGPTAVTEESWGRIKAGYR